MHRAIRLAGRVLLCAATVAAPAIANPHDNSRRAAVAPAPLRLADLLAEARAQSPLLRAAQERARAMGAVPAQKSAFDDPVVSWEGWNAPNPARFDRADNNIFRVAQKLPFPGKRALAGTIAERDADAESHNAAAVELDVVAQVSRAFWMLWQAHQRLHVYERERDLAERFARVAEQRYGVGQSTQSDVLRAQVEVTHFVNRLETQAIEIDSARAELNALLSRDPGAPLGVPEDPAPTRLPASPDLLIESALEHRPELAQQRAIVAREQAGIDLAHKGYLPDFEVSVGQFANSGAPNGFGAMISMTVPIAFKSKYDAGVAEASARLAVAQADQRRLEDQVRREVRQAFLKLRTAHLQHDLFATTHVPQAEQALRVTEAAYQTGSVDFLALIDTVRAISSVHLDHVEAAGDVGKATADLERAVGMPLSDTATEPAPKSQRSPHHG